MNVKVGNRLADPVIDRDKAAFRIERILDRTGKQLSHTHHWIRECQRQIGQRRIVLYGTQQHMSRKKRSVIQKRDDVRILINDVCGNAAAHNLAEDTALIVHFSKFNSAEESEPVHNH